MKTEIDWNKIWKHQMQLHQTNEYYVNQDDFWNNTTLAYEYDRMSNMGHWKKIIVDKIKRLDFSSEYKILDIGSGPGTHAIPLSNKVKHITAIEKADAMIKCLKENIDKYNIKNINLIHSKWEDVELSDLKCPYDVVLASFSLNMNDIKESLIKMNNASSKYVYLLWHIGTPDWEKNYLKLWNKIHNISYHTVPKTDCLFQILYEMGIYPNVETYNMDSFYRFNSLDHALDYFKVEFQIKTKNQEKILLDYLQKTFYKENGHVVMNGFSNYAVIWWDKTNINFKYQ